ALNTDRLSLGGGVAEGGVRRAGEQQSLEGYQTTIEDLRTTEDALRNELRKVGRYANPDAAISALEDVLTPGTAQITIDGRTIFNTSTALGTLETKKQNSIRDATNIIVRRTRPPESDDSLGHRMDQYLRSIDAQYETEKARIQENVDAIRNEITEIRRLQREVNTRQTALNETNQDAIRVRQLSGELSQQYQNLTTWGITDAQLQSETIEQLLSRINAANTTNPANGGWTAEQNTRPDLRMRVHHAIIESRARQANPTALAAPPAEYVTLTAPTGLNITDTQLLSLTPAQIRAEMNRLRRRNPGYPANATEAQIVTAKRIAQERFQARSSAYTEHIAEIDERLAQMDGAEDRISFGDEKLLLDTAESLMTRASEIYGRVSEEVGVNPLITDTAALTPADTQYSQQERDAALPRSYYALMNILFNYQGENRGANFEKLQRLFPPDELARIMAPRLGIVPAGGAAVNINNFTLQLSTDITNRVTTSLEVRRAMQDVIIYFRDQADALE
ncbi:MAG TPA: hypothetical protein VLF68_01330, partial [Candidatus Saccharimonadales bacterium]|nr:hypothetical protein [Candidatus Saccharimonadales bacterium]